MKKSIIIIAIFLAVIAFGIFAYLLFTGPRMRDQVIIKPFQAKMFPIPKGSVPVVATVESLPDQRQAQALTNPLAKTPQNYARGKVYYDYYCVFCHGEKGAGDGPVGYSYVPAVADLRTEKIKSLSEGRLLRAMLTGTGHSPVLERIVAPEHRWYIELYVRSLAQTAEAGGETKKQTIKSSQ